MSQVAQVAHLRVVASETPLSATLLHREVGVEEFVSSSPLGSQQMHRGRWMKWKEFQPTHRWGRARERVERDSIGYFSVRGLACQICTQYSIGLDSSQTPKPKDICDGYILCILR